MNRITSDSTFEMNMHQLALNQVCIKDSWAWYRNGPEDELSVCDLIRRAAETLGVDLPILNDDDLSDLMADWLQYGAEEPEGVLAILYRALCAMAEVRARLAAYEETGLEPEENMDFVEKWKRAVELAGLCKQNDADRLKELLQAEKDGRLSIEPPNDPLTLDELREMDLFEWLWVEVIHQTERQVFRKIESAYYQVFEDYTSGEALCCGWPGLIHEFEYMDYGKTWFAYRRKPEEGAT